MARRPSDASPVKSADRTLDILELLAGEPRGLTISEIGLRLSFARSSTHGLVHTLESRGCDRLELRSVARRSLERLVAATHDTAMLAVPAHGELLYVDKVLSDARDVRTDPRVTSRVPLHCSSLGKALLAAVDDASVTRVLGVTGLLGVTPFTITGARHLLTDLAQTRSRGYAVDQQESIVGVFCVGAPVRDHTGRSVAAISLSTIKDFFTPEKTGPLVGAAAVEVSHAMGWKGDRSTMFKPVAGSEVLLIDSSNRDGARH